MHIQAASCNPKMPWHISAKRGGRPAVAEKFRRRSMPDHAAVNADSSTRGKQLTSYIARGMKREFPPVIIDGAKRALVDLAGVAIGAADQSVVRATRRVAEEWNAAGNAQIFLGGKSTPAVAGLGNRSEER